MSIRRAVNTLPYGARSPAPLPICCSPRHMTFRYILSAVGLPVPPRQKVSTQKELLWNSWKFPAFSRASWSRQTVTLLQASASLVFSEHTAMLLPQSIFTAGSPACQELGPAARRINLCTGLYSCPLGISPSALQLLRQPVLVYSLHCITGVCPPQCWLQETSNTVSLPSESQKQSLHLTSGTDHCVPCLRSGFPPPQMETVTADQGEHPFTISSVSPELTGHSQDPG